jgi:hypothetical protein
MLPIFNRPKFCVKQRPSAYREWQPLFDVQERVLFWWKDRGVCSSLGEAIELVDKLEQAPAPVERKVVYERFSSHERFC